MRFFKTINKEIKKRTSYSLSQQTRDNINELSKNSALDKSQTIEFIISNHVKKYGLDDLKKAFGKFGE